MGEITIVDNVEFVYKEEIWYISSFINTSLVNGDEKSKEIASLVNEKFKNITEDDIYRKDLKDTIFDMINNISINCSWVTYLETFPYYDENSGRSYNILGYFRFNVEYYKDNPLKKETIKPLILQEVPYLVLNVLRKFSKAPENIGIYLDTESPIYVFVTSNKTNPPDINWTKENIKKYKKILGNWTEIYSGQWSDYSDKLYSKRIKNNLSNRLSEMHFIRRNSGFIYMAEINYEKYFESYMIPSVLEPTPKMRAVAFAIRSINNSLDLLFLKTQFKAFINVDQIEEKIKNLRYLRGMIQTNLSVIYNELDYNRRQHYTSVLKHLMGEFRLENLVNRVNEKFKTIYDAIQELYRKESEKVQRRTEKGLNLLNLLFGAGILADLAAVLMLALSLQKGALPTIVLHSIIALFIGGILIITIAYYIYIRMKIMEIEIGKTVDAIIEDGKGNIVLVKRKYPPFKDFYAFPGGFVNEDENAKHAVKREAKEETNLDVKIIDKIGYYDEEGRDPRGNIHTTVYKCIVVGDVSQMRSGDDSKEVELVPIKDLKTLDLAFDHRKILEDAGFIE